MRIPYVREIGLLVVLAIIAWAAHWLYAAGGKQARLDCAQTENARLKAAQAQIERWQKIANDTDDKLQKALKAIPKTRQKVEEAVRAHPTSPDCRVPDDVIARLQDGIRAGSANTAP